jgi:hypothetical protein
MNKEQRRLYKDNPSTKLNEDGTVKTLRQKFTELDIFVEKMMQAVEQDKKLENQKNENQRIDI